MYSSLLLQFRKLSHLRTFVAMQEMSRFTRFGSQKKTVNLGFRAKKTEFPALFPTRYFSQTLKMFYFPATPILKLKLTLIQSKPPLLPTVSVRLLPIRQWAIPSIAGQQHQVQQLHRAQAPQVRPVFQLHPAHRKPHLEMSPGTRKCWTKSQPWKKSMEISTLHGRTRMASSTLQKS